MDNKLVLIVEDSSTIRFQVKALLEQIHVDLRQAGGEIGLFNLIDQYGKIADLIIMDLTLKDENGFELIKKLNSHEIYNKIPVVVMTEHADMKNVHIAKELGVEGYIIKPLNKEIFLGKICDLLGLNSYKPIGTVEDVKAEKQE